MKLNLLPTYVSKGQATKGAVITSILIVILSIGGAIAMINVSGDMVKEATDAARAIEPQAQQAYQTSINADAIIAKSQVLRRNIELVEAMASHNTAYIDLYDKVFPAIPAFFRINSISASPVDGNTATLTLTGVLKTSQEYADLMLAILRIPGAVSVSRSGYQNDSMYVPNLVLNDQSGAPLTPGQSRPPTDPLQKIEWLASNARPTGFTGTGGFGQPDQPLKGAMPGYSAVTITVVITGAKLQAPNPRTTLQSSGGGAPPAGGGGGGPQRPAGPAGAGADGDMGGVGGGAGPASRDEAAQ